MTTPDITYISSLDLFAFNLNLSGDGRDPQKRLVSISLRCRSQGFLKVSTVFTFTTSYGKLFQQLMTFWLKKFARRSKEAHVNVSFDLTSAFVGQVGMDVPVKFSDSRSNRSRDTRLPDFVTNNDDDDAGRRTRQ